ncbi:MAG TPA: NAD(P)-dependent oxidoreductase [Bacillota bacterium]|nr:NAD(P)-dependent oxidoreductase [Bacillota bacterium]
MDNKKKVLITYSLPEEGLEELYKDFDVTMSHRGAMAYNDLLPLIHDYDALLAAGINVDENLIEKAKNLKVINVYGAGYDNVDIDAATRRGITVTHIPDTVTEPTAELAIGLMLSVTRRIAECDRKLRQNKEFSWSMSRQMGYNLYGRELGIVGLGRIGMATAKRAVALGMKISYYNRNKLGLDEESAYGASYKQMDDLLARSDVISLHTPLHRGTHHLIGERELSLIKPTAFIINTARGAVIDEKALVKRLSEGKLAGAGLDVFEGEPRIPKELLTMDNVVLTPHIGTYTYETIVAMTRDASKNIMDILRGHRPANVINPETL